MLIVNKLNKIYTKNNHEYYALKDVSFTLSKNERLGIVGASGSGKSTILKILSLLEKPTSGDILLDNKYLGANGAAGTYRILQMVFQNPYDVISPRMKIGDFLKEPLVNFQLCDKALLENRIDTVLNEVGLPIDVKFRFGHEVSGGQLQRVVIARTLLAEPQIILFDEPTSALDFSVQQRVLDLINRLYNHRPFTYIFVGHDIDVVRKMTDRILVMHEGEIVEELDTHNAKCIATHPYTKRLIEATSLARLQ